MSSVMVAELWPSICWTTLTSAPEAIARLAAASNRLRTLYAAHPMRFEGPGIQRRLDVAQNRLEPEVWARAWAEGRALDLDEAIALALG